MLRVLGSPKRFCSGPTRRDSLLVGGLSLFGLSLADQLKAAEKKPAAGKAKACILLYLYGSPSQLEMADMKPDAPAEIRGELKPIASSLPAWSRAIISSQPPIWASPTKICGKVERPERVIIS